MNASMNDTHNLSKLAICAVFGIKLTNSLVWKLSHVLRGWADVSLLKTVSRYHIITRAIAKLCIV